MRDYEVRPGDSPAKIAIEYAGCPKCAIDLVRANPHKETVTMPNGFVTFRELKAGEKLNLPDKWFNGELDMRPPAYFAALPYADGVTPGKLGLAGAGVLGDYATLDAASAKVASLPPMSDQEFSEAVNPTAGLIEQAVSEAVRSPNTTAAGYAQDATAGTYWAREAGNGMAAALAAGDPSASSNRADIQNVLSTALGSARLALQALYGASTPATGSDPVLAAAQAAAAAMASDASYCESVAHPGSAVNSAVHAFKTAWNASRSPAVPINTGNYEQATADALNRVLGNAPAACRARAPVPQPPPIAPLPPVAVVPPQAKGISTGAIIGMGLLGAGAVGGAIYLATQERPRLTREYRQPHRGFQ